MQWWHGRVENLESAAAPGTSSWRAGRIVARWIAASWGIRGCVGGSGPAATSTWRPGWVAETAPVATLSQDSGNAAWQPWIPYSVAAAWGPSCLKHVCYSHDSSVPGTIAGSCCPPSWQAGRSAVTECLARKSWREFREVELERQRQSRILRGCDKCAWNERTNAQQSGKSGSWRIIRNRNEIS